MEYTELSDYHFPAGALTAWEPTADPDAWADDPRRLSYMHLEHARRAQSMGEQWYSEWIGTAFRIPERLDAAALSEALSEWYRRHEAFRSSIVTDGTHSPEDDMTRRTVAASAVSVQSRPLGIAASGDDARAVTQEYFNTTVSPLRWPHCVAVTVAPTGDDTGFLLVFAADHTVMDAYTQVFAIRELTTLYRAALDGAAHDLPDYGSYLDFAEAERDLGAQIDDNNSAVTLWRQFFDADTTASQPTPMPAFPYSDSLLAGGSGSGAWGSGASGSAAPSIRAQRIPDAGYQASLSSDLLDAAATKQFDAICKAAGGSMAAGIYTALAMANQMHSGDEELRFISPVHTRTAPQWGEAVGWFVNVIPVHVRPGGATSFTAALPAVGASVGQYREVGAAPFAPIADVIGGDTTPPAFVISYIDLRRAEGAGEWEARRARVLRSATTDADEVYFWINRIPDGLNVSARFPAGPRGRAVEVFLSTFAEILRTVVADGDATISPASIGSLVGARPVDASDPR